MNIPQLDEAEQEVDIRASDPIVTDFAPMVHCKFQCSRSTPLLPVKQLHTPPPTPPEPMSSIPIPFSPLSQAHIEQIKPTRKLASPNPVPFPPISTLPSYPLHHGLDSEEDETQPE